MKEKRLVMKIGKEEKRKKNRKSENEKLEIKTKRTSQLVNLVIISSSRKESSIRKKVKSKNMKKVIEEMNRLTSHPVRQEVEAPGEVKAQDTRMTKQSTILQKIGLVKISMRTET